MQSATKMFLSVEVAVSKTTSAASVPAFLARTSIESDVFALHIRRLLACFLLFARRIRPRPFAGIE